MGDYDFRPGGSLKLKGDKPKKKKKSLASGERAEREASIERQAQAATAAAKASTSSRRTETPDVGSGGEGSKKTAAEEKFDRIQDERRRERARKNAHKTHKDRVADFNASLDRLSEHHDLPRIGPG